MSDPMEKGVKWIRPEDYYRVKTSKYNPKESLAQHVERRRKENVPP